MDINLGNKKLNISKTYLVLGIVLVLSVILILIVGNKKNSNSIMCTLKNSNDSGSFTTVYSGNFKNDQLNTLTIDYKNEPTSSYLYMIDDIYNNYERQLSELKSAGGYNYKLNKDKKYVSYKVTIDINKIPDSTKEVVGFNNEWSLEKFKKNLEDNGFECK